MNTVIINPLKDKLARHEPIAGIWSIIPSAPLIEVLACAGFDLLILDMEHGAFGFETLENCIRACELSASAAIVRPPGADLFSIQKALDLGAHGILIPQMANFAAASNAIGMTKFAPDGNRGFNPFTRAAKYCPPPKIPSGKLDNRYGLSGVIIETSGAYKQLPQILALPMLDWVYLGIYDMSVSLGCAGNTKHPLVLKFTEKATKLAHAAGKMVGLMVRDEDEVKQALSIGIQIIVFSVDTFIIRQAAEKALALIRKAKAGV